jgi:hypothetical protein
MRILKKLFGRDDGGETREFLDLVEGSVEGLQLQTSAHQGTWHFGEEERWNIDQDSGELIFTFPEVIAMARAQIIGTIDTHAGTWMWAWANSSVADALKKDSLRVRAYGEEHGIRRLITPSWPAEENDAWRMTALASRFAESNGAYRGPAGGTHIYMTFGKVTLKKREPNQAAQTTPGLRPSVSDL